MQLYEPNRILCFLSNPTDRTYSRFGDKTISCILSFFLLLFLTESYDQLINKLNEEI